MSVTSEQIEKVRGKPYCGINQPNRAISGAEANIINVGCSEYMLFLILLGITSIIIRCDRICANPPNRFVIMKMKKIRVVGIKESIGKSSIGRTGEVSEAGGNTTVSIARRT